MRLRYVLILLLAIGVAFGSYTLSARIYHWRTLPSSTPNPAAVAAIEHMPFPADYDGLEVVERKLAELGQAELLRAINLYLYQRPLAQALGEEPAAVESIASVREWASAHADQIHESEQRIIRGAFELRLAPPGTVPPKDGRLGADWNASYVDQGEGLWQTALDTSSDRRQSVFVLEVTNRLHLPVHNFSFGVIPLDAQGQPASLSLPKQSYLWCDQYQVIGDTRRVDPGATLSMTCGMRIAGPDPVPVESLQSALRTLRTAPLVAWSKELSLLAPGPYFSEIQLRDSGVSAEYGHAPSSNVDIGFATPERRQEKRAQLPVRLTSCRDRGDCLQTWLKPFEGSLGTTWMLIVAMLPGYLVAGLKRLLNHESHGLAVGLFAILALVLVPRTFHEAGGGYGPLVAMMLLGAGSIGYWAGYVFGYWASIPVNLPSDSPK